MEGEEVWLQHGDCVCGFDVPEDGRVDVNIIAATWGLDPSTFIIEDHHVRVGDGGKSVRSINNFRSTERDGRSKDRALRLEARPAVPQPQLTLVPQPQLTEFKHCEHCIFVTKMLKQLIAGQRKLESGVFASLWLTFWGDISSSVSTEDTVQFRKNLVAYYGDEVDKQNVDVPEKPLRCMVTGLRLPGKWITAARLLARKDRAKSHIFGINDIQDPRNGLLWNRAIEEAFTLFQIVFSWSNDLNSFHIHILDKNLVTQKLSQMKLRKPLNRSLDSFMDADTKTQFDNMVFGDLEGRLMTFNNLNRPFKRVLCVHAKVGIYKARLDGSLPPSLDLEKYNFDYWTDSADAKLLSTFLKDSQAWIDGEVPVEDADLDLKWSPIESASTEDNQ